MTIFICDHGRVQLGPYGGQTPDPSPHEMQIRLDIFGFGVRPTQIYGCCLKFLSKIDIQAQS